MKEMGSRHGSQSIIAQCPCQPSPWDSIIHPFWTDWDHPQEILVFLKSSQFAIKDDFVPIQGTRSPGLAGADPFRRSLLLVLFSKGRLWVSLSAQRGARPGFGARRPDCSCLTLDKISRASVSSSVKWVHPLKCSGKSLASQLHQVLLWLLLAPFPSTAECQVRTLPRLGPACLPACSSLASVQKVRGSLTRRPVLLTSVDPRASLHTDQRLHPISLEELSSARQPSSLPESSRSLPSMPCSQCCTARCPPPC